MRRVYTHKDLCVWAVCVYLFFFFLIFFFKVYLFLGQREPEHERGRGREREGDTESETGSRLGAISPEPDTGLKLMDREIVPWLKSDA